MRHLYARALIFGAILIPFAAQASPPWFVDWARTPAFQHILLRLSYVSVDRYASFDKRVQYFPRYQFALGLNSNTELNGQLNWITRTGGHYPFGGWSDTALGLKHRFIGKSSGDAFLLGAAYTLSIPTGRHSKGFGTSGYDQTVSALSSQRLMPGLFLHEAVGETFYDRDGLIDGALGGVMLTSETDKGHSIVGLQLSGNEHKLKGAKDDLQVSLGMTRDFTPRDRLMLNFGHSFRGYGDVIVWAGLQFDRKVLR